MPKRTQRTRPGRNKKKESVASMTFSGINKLRGKEKKSLRKPMMRSRSFTPRTLNQYESYMEAHGVDGDDAVNGEIFFNQAIGSSMYCKPQGKGYLPANFGHQDPHNQPIKKSKSARTRVGPSERSTGGSWAVSTGSKPRISRGGDKDEEDDDNIPDWLENAFDNSDRHALGMGLMEKLFGGGANKNEMARRKKRPYFTYWVSIMQIIIFIVAICFYGIAPIGLSKTEITDEVLMTNLAIEKVSYFEIANLWIGPTQADLIHVGAKYSPCMREDVNIQKVLAIDKERERKTGCCVYNDGSGCVQSKSSACSSTLATFLNWTTANPGYQSRESGPVCGQDPEYCLEPPSVEPNIWADDITEWPVCTKTANTTSVNDNNRHMTCEVVGRPCCVGIQGDCVIATREYCDFRNGYFHDEATTCSQVSCMEEICGMFPFSEDNKPNQFYRLFTSLFLHSGILALLITLVIQLIIQRDLEKMIGWWRMTLIYIGSGLAGSLGSVIFMPYYVESGPSGSTFGALGAFSFEIFRWNVDETGENPVPAVAKMSGFLLVFFLLGTVVTSIDNWAHLFGYFFGLALAIGLRPLKVWKGQKTSTWSRAVTAIVAIAIAIAIFAFLVVLFYVAPVYECAGCLYFNCIPFTSTYCDGMEVSIERSDEL